jgi:hypothetical protein
MTRVLLCLAVLTTLLGPRTAPAVLGTPDVVPAATLLLPYFEVDLDNPNHVDTSFSFSNATSAAVIAHVTLWTDWSVPTFVFDVPLSGYDIEDIYLRSVFSGQLPEAAVPSTLSPAQVQHLQAAHTGIASPILGGLCAGRPFGDRVARGYITVDLVKAMDLRNPTQAGYFAQGGTGLALNDNAIWGNYAIIRRQDDSAIGENLVHIEAADSLTGSDTFYSRYVAGSGADNRESLTAGWAARYALGGNFDGGTDLVVWRDPGVAQAPVLCGSSPAWFPLGQTQVVVFDEQANSQILGQGFPFPAAANRTAVGSALPVPYNFGWLRLDLTAPPTTRQAYVSVIMTANGRFQVGHKALQLGPGTGP